MKPPNYRNANECTSCKHCKCTHSCGCCPLEYKCLKHNCDVYECSICDDFELEE